MVHRKNSRGRGRGANRVDCLQPAASMASPSVNKPRHLPQPDPAPSNNDPDDLCGTCSVITGADAVGCDRCSNWFHPTSMCLGLPDQLIQSIQTYGGDGVAFICTECRTGNNSDDVPNSAFKQLFQTVKKLCETVQSLSTQVASLTSPTAPPRQGAAHSLPGIAQNTSQDKEYLCTLIREEAREMEERQKRRCSVIVRGIQAQSAETFGPAFHGICSSLLGSSVTFTNAMCISKEKRIFRVKIEDDDSRKALLDNARNLRNGPYQNVFINRDLTYKQRGELKARRELRKNAASAGRTSQSQTVRTEQGNPTGGPGRVPTSAATSGDGAGSSGPPANLNQ